MSAQIFTSPKTVLRHDPSYFNSFSLFDTRAQRLFPLSEEQYSLLEIIHHHGLDKDLAEGFFRATVRARNGQYAVIWDDIKANCLTEQENRKPRRRADDLAPNCSDGDVGITRTPTFVDLCITRRCNLACVHCNVSAHSLKPKEKSSLSFWKGVIDELIGLNVLKVIITGGEPTQYTHWAELYDHICDQPLAVSILTNGTGLSERTIPAARANGHNFAISLDGATDTVHDDFRRRTGSFAETLSTLGALQRHNTDFSLSVTLHSGNVGQVDELVSIAERFGALGICFNAINHVGRGGTSFASKYYPSKSAVKLAFDRAKAIAGRGADTEIVMGDFEEREYNHISSRISGSTQMSRRNPGLCKAGIYALAIDEDGTVYSCLRGLQTKVNPIGSLKDRALQDLWTDHRWNDFRRLDLPRVACRIEEIENRPLSVG